MSRVAFLVVWGLVDIGTCLMGLFAIWLGLRVFRGATVVTPSAGETLDRAEDRADRLLWRFMVPMVVVTGLLLFAFIIWQSTVLY